MFILEDVLLLHAPFERRATSSGWIGFNCPCCVAAGESRPDTRRRGGLYLGAHEIRYYCFNCSTSASWQPGQPLDRRMRFVLECFGVPDQEIERIKFQIARERLSAPTRREEPISRPSFAERPLPAESRPLLWWLQQDDCPDDAMAVAEYVVGRGLSEYWSYWWTPQKKYQMHRRLIVPFFQRGKTVGYTSRLIDNTVSDLPRYYSSVASDYIFNIDRLYDRERKYLCLVEGALDAIAVDGAAVLGRTISQNQQNWLNQSGKTIIVLPDRDVGKRSLLDYVERNRWMVSFPWEFYGGDGLWERDVKDAAAAVQRYGRIYAVRSILERAHNNYTRISLMKKRFRER